MFTHILSKFMGYVYTLWETTLHYSFSLFNKAMRYIRQDKPWAQRIEVAAQARESGSQIKAMGTWKPGLLIPQLMLFPLLFRSLFLQVWLAIQKHQCPGEAYMPWRLVNNAASQAPLQTYSLRICI